MLLCGQWMCHFLGNGGHCEAVCEQKYCSSSSIAASIKRLLSSSVHSVEVVEHDGRTRVEVTSDLLHSFLSLSDIPSTYFKECKKTHG